MGKNAQRRRASAREVVEATLLYRHMPDLKGRDKPPCFMCGERSDGWIVFSRSRERACADCISVLSVALFNGGHSVEIHHRESGEVHVHRQPVPSVTNR